MEFVHRCLFCGSSRAAASATILAPHCERCGCLIVSERRVPEGEPILSAPRWVEGAVTRHSVLLPAIRVAVGMVLLLGAAAVGYDAAGIWFGLAAFGVCGLLLLPLLIPER